VLTTERFEGARLEHGTYFLLGPVSTSAPEGIVARRVLPGSGVTLWECVGPVRPSTAPAPGSTAPTTQED
jgi:hypothetical protein